MSAPERGLTHPACRAPAVLLQDSFKRNVPILALCQALFMSGSSLLVATSALVGFALADDKPYASAGFPAQLLATMLASLPAAALMSRSGRKPAFMIGTLIAAAGAVVCTWAIVQHRFDLFIVGSVLLGTFSGFANYYRFAAADNVDEAHKSRAIAYVLAGGVLAAVIGPNLASLTRELVSDAVFAGSYASITVLYLLSFVLLTLLDLPRGRRQGRPGAGSRPRRGHPEAQHQRLRRSPHPSIRPHARCSPPRPRPAPICSPAPAQHIHDPAPGSRYARPDLRSLRWRPPARVRRGRVRVRARSSMR